MSRILRSEFRRQVRLYQDWLRVACFTQYPKWLWESKLRTFRRLAAQTTEVSWQGMLRQLPKKSDRGARAATLHLLGGAQLPQEVAEVIQKGPKYSLQPKIPAHEMLALNRRIAGKAEQEDDHERCLLEGVIPCCRRVRANFQAASRPWAWWLSTSGTTSCSL
ncbi:hypothetical protein HPB48_017362 [Haemaphysalis longicornis]|uniref:Uncharacterized protein n=1 Tax=Haemaphysalis longicornis TaxID=44386 RepID=A0A9J6GWH2_HAELO|nr:hypothetical protein HPB48_017362 [Haemaphysalis longicornis]